MKVGWSEVGAPIWLWLLAAVICCSLPLRGQDAKHLKRLRDWDRPDLPPETRLKATDALIRKSYWKSNLDSAYYYIDRQHDLATRTHNNKWVARARQSRGYLEYRQGNYAASEELLHQAFQLYQLQHDWAGMAETTRILANNYRKTGRVPQALDALQQALLYAQRLNDGKGMASQGNILNSLGSLYLYQEDYPAARDFYERSLVIHRELGKQLHIAANLNNLSKVLAVEGEYSKAIAYLNESIEIKGRNRDLEGIANSLKNKGDIYLEQGLPDSARTVYLQAMNLQDSLGLHEDQASILADLGLVALREENWKSALHYCGRARHKAAELGNPAIGAKANNCKYRAHRELQEYREALAALERSQALESQYLSSETTRQIKELEIDYLRERMDLEYLLSEERKLEKRTFRNRIKLGLLFLAFILGWVLALYWWKRIRNPAKPVTPAQQLDPAPEPAIPSTVLTNAPTGDPWLGELDATIHADLERGLPVNAGSLATSLHVSNRQLLRRIKAASGFTTQQYILDVRLRYAKTLLERGSFQTVKEAAITVGFNSPGYFSQRFAEKFGRKPADLL